MAWQFKDRSSVYSQIIDRLRADILGGKYQPGEQLPAIRSLAIDAGVNPNTMQRALAELEGEGLFETRGTLGRFVTQDSEVLQAAATLNKKKVMQKIITEAESVGITPNELAEYLNLYNNNTRSAK